MEKRIIFATGNENKMVEIRMILADLGIPIYSMKEAGIDIDIVEDGSTFEENAVIKASAIAKLLPNDIILADDSGLEIDYLDETYNASIPYFQELPLDYRIGSIHFLPVSERLVEENMVCIDGSFREYAHSVERHFEGDVRLLVKRFFDTTMKMIEAGGIDIVGHMDKIYMNGQKYEIFNFEEDWYRKPFEACLDLVQEKGLMVEVNTKNWTKKKELYPRVEYLSRMREMNIPVMVNSDCHYPDLVNDGRKEAFKLLKQAGFKSTRELVKGKWQDIAL